MENKSSQNIKKETDCYKDTKLAVIAIVVEQEEKATTNYT